MQKVLALLKTIWIYTLLGWAYVAGIALLQPQFLRDPLSHFTPWLPVDAFGIACFVISAATFFLYEFYKSKTSKR